MENKKECKWYKTCPMRTFYENGKIDKKWVDDYCHGNWNICVRFIKEEGGIYHPDNMLPNGEIDEELL